MTVWQVNFEDRRTDEWLGLVLIDRAGDVLNDDDAGEFIAELTARGLTPPPVRKWWVHFRRLPPEANIPSELKNRLITDPTETAAHGFEMMSKHGPN
jgi:hypothetical protein